MKKWGRIPAKELAKGDRIGWRKKKGTVVWVYGSIGGAFRFDVQWDSGVVCKGAFPEETPIRVLR